ncbi:hypothetical protein D0869_12082 [Hortaea werneckii]|nr:hypothetical protein D0869_12082 [Hortaea werneckii]
MTAVASSHTTQPHHHHHEPYFGAGRSSKLVTPVYSTRRAPASPAGSHALEEKSLATKLNDESRAGARSSASLSLSSSSRELERKPLPHQRTNSLPQTTATRTSTKTVRRKPLKTTMSSYASTTSVPPAPRPSAGHAKLHKRNFSGSSQPGPPSPMSGVQSAFSTPYATYEEKADSGETPPLGSTSRLKPYMRKMSSAKEESRDQGQIDLSKSSLDNDRLTGLGIQDFGNVPSASDVSFAHAARRGTHARATSVGSQVSSGSGSFKPTLPFTHPMRQNPQPYTPPTCSSNASLVNAEEIQESDDVFEDDLALGQAQRNKRSMSTNSIPAMPPPPLLHSHTAKDLGMVPKLTSASQTNLSIQSGRSEKSSRNKRCGPKRETGASFDIPTTASSRTSFDKAFSFVSKKSDGEPVGRDERIREARRKFEEKEAYKDRKYEKEKLKRRQTDEAKKEKQEEKQRRKSEASERTRPSNQSSPKKATGKKSFNLENEQLRAQSYDEARPADLTSLPRQGDVPGMSEKVPRLTERKVRDAQGGWVRFSAWFQTRMLNCAAGH